MGERILIVDDAYFIRSMMKDILVGAGYDVCGEASTGAEAIQKYTELKPDLIIMDIMLPDMDGIEAINAIKERDPNAKIMMCSSVGNAASIVKAINAGAREFILKPFQPARVLNAVENILG